MTTNSVPPARITLPKHCSRCGAVDLLWRGPFSQCCEEVFCGGSGRQRWLLGKEVLNACCMWDAYRQCAGRGTPRRVALW